MECQETYIDSLKEKLQSIYGMTNNIETVLDYYKYAELYKQNNITGVGNLNVQITSEEETDGKKVAYIFLEILQNLEITNEEPYFISKQELVNKEELEKVDSKVIVINESITNISSKVILDNIRKYIAQNKDKIFIMLVKKRARVEQLSEFFWQIKNEITTSNEKKRYILEKLKCNDITVNDDVDYLNRITDYNIEDVDYEILKLILLCRENNVTTITNEFVNENIIENKEIKKSEEKPKSTSKSALEELDELIGLEDIKQQIHSIVNYVKTRKDRHHPIMLHMALMGNSGCGKNEVAKNIGKIFKEEKILSKGDFIEISRADLVGSYIGHSEEKTREILQKAKGSVLFIDEAYSLEKESERDYGNEVLAEIIKAMEDCRDDMCIILAGYTQEMEKLLKKNSGLNSRIPFKLYFEDYSSEQLYEIFEKLAKKNDYILSTDIRPILIEHFKIARKTEDFGNGRYARSLLEKAEIEQAQRAVTDDKADKDMIELCDVTNAIQQMKTKEPIRRQIGFETLGVRYES